MASRVAECSVPFRVGGWDGSGRGDTGWTVRQSGQRAGPLPVLEAGTQEGRDVRGIVERKSIDFSGFLPFFSVLF